MSQLDAAAQALAGPFTTADAVAAGVTPTQLQSRRFRQIFRGVWTTREVEDSRELRLAAARLVIPPKGRLCGPTAAWVHGADVRRLDDFDVHVGFRRGERIRNRPGIVVCQETLDDEDIVVVDGLRLTSPTRTAFDCLRWLRYPEGVVVADSLSHLGLVTVDDLRIYFSSKKRLRNLRIGERMVDLIEPLTESPMETRMRIALIDGGLPRPQPQHEVHRVSGGFVGRLDLAYPEAKLGVEYDGADHWKQRREDDRRRAAIRACGWEVLVYSADDVFKTPWAMCAEVRTELRRRTA
jgi:very-short-patch-repair endonuclease